MAKQRVRQRATKLKDVVLYDPPEHGPKVLIFDIETAPMLGHVWSLWNNDVSLNQVKSDWYILSWSAKWLNAPADQIMYMDQRHAKNIEDDSRILKYIWILLDKADVVITQNGKAFDHKKLNARFILNGFRPPSTYKHIDTKVIANKHFAFTSSKLEYMTDKLCTKFKKLKPKKYAGFEMWRECMAGNMEAWREMEKYNKHDVLALEELFHKLSPWDNTINFSLYREEVEHVCRCGSKSFHKNGFYYTSTGKYQRYRCSRCGAETRDRKNLFSKEKRDSLRVDTPRSN